MLYSSLTMVNPASLINCRVFSKPQQGPCASASFLCTRLPGMQKNDPIVYIWAQNMLPLFSAIFPRIAKSKKLAVPSFFSDRLTPFIAFKGLGKSWRVSWRKTQWNELLILSGRSSKSWASKVTFLRPLSVVSFRASSRTDCDISMPTNVDLGYLAARFRSMIPLAQPKSQTRIPWSAI